MTKIKEIKTTTDYYVEIDGVPYKIVRMTWAPEPEWRRNKSPGGDWYVYSSQGFHRYTRLCDPEKVTHKRVVAALQTALMEKTESDCAA